MDSILFNRGLYPEEDFFLIQEIQEDPLDGNDARGKNQNAQGRANKFRRDGEQRFAGITPTDKLPRHVDQYRVHADDAEEEGPFLISLYIDDKIKKCEEQEADAASEQHKRAGPEILVDREAEVPEQRQRNQHSPHNGKVTGFCAAILRARFDEGAAEYAQHGITNRG